MMHSTELLTLYFLGLTPGGHPEDKVRFIKDTFGRYLEPILHSPKEAIEIALEMNQAFRSGVLPEWMTQPLSFGSDSAEKEFLDRVHVSIQSNDIIPEVDIVPGQEMKSEEKKEDGTEST